MRYWSATNPNVLLKTPLHPQKVTIWCGFHVGGVIGRMAASFMRYNAIGFLFMGPNHVTGLCQQASNFR